MNLQPTLLAKSLAELMLKLEPKPEPIPTPEVTYLDPVSGMVEFELADMLGAPAKPNPYKHTEVDTEFWQRCQVEPDLAFME